MKKILFLAFIFLILNIYLINAASVDVKITPINNIVAPIQTATYSVSITNNQNTDLTFEFIYLDIDWRPSPEKVVVPAFSNKNVELSLVPQPPYSENKNKFVHIIVSTTDKTTYRQDFFPEVNVLSYNQILDQSISNLIIPDPLDPRKPTLIRLKLINTKNVALNNINIKLKSDFFEENKVISLAPSESETLDFPEQLSESTKFGVYPITALVRLDDKILANFTTEMRVGSYPKVTEIKSPRSGFLLDVFEITKTNEGNSVSHEAVTKKLTGFQSRFTKTNPKPSSIAKQDPGYLYTWEFDLQQGESKTVTIETNYRGFFSALVIIIIILVVIYVLTKREIDIRKKIVSIKKDSDGSSTIKISISVKNKGLTKLNNIKVMDRVPSLVEVPHEFGTAHPKITHGPHGIQLIWDITVLNPKEERIFSYMAKSKLQVIGKATIPSAVAKYTKGKRSLVVSSNPEHS